MRATCDPVTVADAHSREEDWKSAMKDEMDSLMKHRVWTLEELPFGRNAVTGKWIFNTSTSDFFSTYYVRHVIFLTSPLLLLIRSKDKLNMLMSNMNDF